MTEEEAKTKWCPFMDPDKPLIVPESYRRAVQAAVGAAPITCIGSACMAWRKDQSTPLEKDTMARFGLVIEDWMEAALGHPTKAMEAIQAAEIEGWYATDGTAIAGMSWNIGRGIVAHGFCGLAGKP